ncbi:hypothetical protein ACRRTK_023546 [Alexandromys fortis]
MRKAWSQGPTSYSCSRKLNPEALQMSQLLGAPRVLRYLGTAFACAKAIPLKLLLCCLISIDFK